MRERERERERERITFVMETLVDKPNTNFHFFTLVHPFAFEGSNLWTQPTVSDSQLWTQPTVSDSQLWTQPTVSDSQLWTQPTVSDSQLWTAPTELSLYILLISSSTNDDKNTSLTFSETLSSLVRRQNIYFLISGLQPWFQNRSLIYRHRRFSKQPVSLISCYTCDKCTI